MQERQTEHTIANTYRSSVSDLMLTIGVVLLIVTPIIWPSLKVIFG